MKKGKNWERGGGAHCELGRNWESFSSLIRLAALILTIITVLTLPLSASKYAATGTGSAIARIAKWDPKITGTNMTNWTPKTVLMRKDSWAAAAAPVLSAATTSKTIMAAPLFTAFNNSGSEVSAAYQFYPRLVTAWASGVPSVWGDVPTTLMQLVSNNFTQTSPLSPGTIASLSSYTLTAAQQPGVPTFYKAYAKTGYAPAAADLPPTSVSALASAKVYNATQQFYETVEFYWEAVQVD